MIDMIAQYVHKAIEATTPWLVGAAIGFLVLWLVMLCRRAGPFAKELKWFFSLTPLHKFIVIFAVQVEVAVKRHGGPNQPPLKRWWMRCG